MMNTTRTIDCIGDWIFCCLQCRRYSRPPIPFPCEKLFAGYHKIKCLCYSITPPLNYLRSGKGPSKSHGKWMMKLMRWCQLTGQEQGKFIIPIMETGEDCLTILANDRLIDLQADKQILSVLLCSFVMAWRTDVSELQQPFADVFSPLPDCTNLIHIIVRLPGCFFTSLDLRATGRFPCL